MTDGRSPAIRWPSAIGHPSGGWGRAKRAPGRLGPRFRELLRSTPAALNTEKNEKRFPARSSVARDGRDPGAGLLAGFAGPLALGVAGAAEEIAPAAAADEHRTAAVLAGLVDLDRFQVR